MINKNEELKVIIYLATAFIFITSTIPANALTYNYSGPQWNYIIPDIAENLGTHMTGTVTFNDEIGDHYTGRISSEEGYAISSLSFTAGAHIITKTGTEIFQSPEEINGYLFYLVDGQITYWIACLSTVPTLGAVGDTFLTTYQQLESPILRQDIIAIENQHRAVWSTEILPPSDVTHGVWSIASLPTPMPEPTTILLFGAGLVGLAGVGRRKKQQ